MNKLSEFFLMMMGISADEEKKQRREHEHWERQREIAKEFEDERKRMVKMSSEDAKDEAQSSR